MKQNRQIFPVQVRLTGEELLHALELVAPDAFLSGFHRNHPQLHDAVVIAKTELPPEEKRKGGSRVATQWVADATSAVRGQDPVRIVAEQLMSHAGFEIKGDILQRTDPNARSWVRRSQAIVSALARSAESSPPVEPGPADSDHLQ